MLEIEIDKIDRKRAYDREYRTNHIVQRREYKKRYYAEHPEYREGRRVYLALYRAKNLGPLRQKAQENAANNKDKKREYDKIYRLRPQKRYASTRANAFARKMEFNLTFDEFMFFWEQSCVYCGGKIETANLDRIDNAKGYVLGNVASCCATCNMMKRTMGVDEFISHCRKISNFNEQNQEVTNVYRSCERSVSYSPRQL